MKRFRWAILPILLCFSVWTLFQTMLFVGVVPSASMEPTIPAGSLILGCRFFKELERGEVIVFRHEGKTLVKRVVAVEGDVVSLNDRDGSFTVNRKQSDATRVLTVPEGCFFVVGDNREDSLDSRVWGEPFVENRQVVAVPLHK